MEVPLGVVLAAGQMVALGVSGEGQAEVQGEEAQALVELALVL